MIRWFQGDAPIRKKFSTLFCLYVALGAVPVATTAAAAMKPEQAATLTLMAVVALVLIGALTLCARKLICDPYVSTLVRMERLAQGDFATPIDFGYFQDCVGRMARAMGIFRRNGEALAAASGSQIQVVKALGEGLARLAANDLSHRIVTPFASVYEQLRIDFNRAMGAWKRPLLWWLEPARASTMAPPISGRPRTTYRCASSNRPLVSRKRRPQWCKSPPRYETPRRGLSSRCGGEPGARGGAAIKRGGRPRHRGDERN
ncbi:hypothetical protein ACMGDM_16915 [Sphingomonas sp. DT-51]|uniref:hypothetical protein n=1 Tax=Sphingomonas sp. DT-51 TaxID=3396165 RepID=UPI003F1C5A41